jgi:Lrp/AsnC family transcriptional regulator
MESMSPQDKELLKILQKNSKFDITELTQKLHMSRTSVYERIKKLEHEGFIKGYVALIDEKKVGLNFTVIVNVQLKSQQFEVTEEFARQIREIDEVMQAYVISGVYDCVLKVVVKDPEAFNDFVVKKLSVIPEVSKIQSSFVMSYMKQSTELPF